MRSDVPDFTLLTLELFETAWKLEPGQVSPVVHTGEDFHILYMNAKEPAARKSFEKARVEGHHAGRDERKAALRAELMRDLRARCGVRVTGGTP